MFPELGLVSSCPKHTYSLATFGNRIMIKGNGQRSTTKIGLVVSKMVFQCLSLSSQQIQMGWWNKMFWIAFRSLNHQSVVQISDHIMFDVFLGFQWLVASRSLLPVDMCNLAM